MSDNIFDIETRGPFSAAHLFIPERLTVARESKGLTKAQLAERLEKTASSISQLESGRIKPDPKTIAKIALSLGLPLSFFTKKLRSKLLSVDDAHFRSLRSATQLDKKKILSLGTIACELLSYCEEFVDFPQEQVSCLSQHPNSIDEIEEFAITIRKEWGLGLGPIDNVISLLESKGIIVILIPESFHEIGAFSAWYGKRPFIFLLDKDSPSKLRFDAIHELGHLLMHADVKPGDQILEREANRFSSAFLLPRPPFSQECPRRFVLEHFYELKERWKVSVAALVRRAFDLNILSEASYRRAYIHLNQIGERMNESREPEKEFPVILKQAFELVSSKFTLQEILESQGLSIIDLEKILNFEK